MCWMVQGRRGIDLSRSRCAWTAPSVHSDDGCGDDDSHRHRGANPLIIAIDIWPDNQAVSPSLNAGRTFRPSKHRKSELKARGRWLEIECTQISEGITQCLTVKLYNDQKKVSASFNRRRQQGRFRSSHRARTRWTGPAGVSQKVTFDTTKQNRPNGAVSLAATIKERRSTEIPPLTGHLRQRPGLRPRHIRPELTRGKLTSPINMVKLNSFRVERFKCYGEARCRGIISIGWSLSLQCLIRTR